jgi:hypothetical protein
MDMDTLRRHVDIHRAYAKAFQNHLRRIWKRELSPKEMNSTQSFTLCTSLMCLESIERHLAAAVTQMEANECFCSMESDMSRNTEYAIKNLEFSLSLGADAPSPHAFSNLLAWEMALRDWMETQP